VFETALRCFCLAGTVLLAAASVGTTARADQTLITFEDLPGSTNLLAIPNGYKNFTWSNLHYMDGVHYVDNPSGYQNGVVSTNQVAFLWGDQRGDPLPIAGQPLQSR
jgi:hypothetical protein